MTQFCCGGLNFGYFYDRSPIIAYDGEEPPPLVVLDAECADPAPVYSHKLVLSRPDQHVAWRGNAQPDDPMALIDMVRGVLSGVRPLAQPSA